MNRPIAILLIVLTIVGLLFSTFALSQGKFVEALLVYPLLIIVYIFSRHGNKVVTIENSAYKKHENPQS